MKLSRISSWCGQPNAAPRRAAAIALAVILSQVTAGVASPNVVAWGSLWEASGTVPDDLTNAAAVAAGVSYAVALRSDGTVTGWGTLPGVLPALTNILAVAGNAYGLLVLEPAGAVAGWGDPAPGDPNTVLPPGLSDVVAISANGGNALALRSDGSVVGWGIIVGQTSWVDQASITLNLTNAVAVAAGNDHSVALLADGTVVQWGGSISEGPTNPPPGLSNVVSIAAGQYFSVALLADGTVVEWGPYPSNGNYESVPPGISNVVAIAAGGLQVLALRADGTVVAWGAANEGETNVPPGLTNVVAIGTGVTYSMAVIGQSPPTQQAPVTGATLSAGQFSAQAPTGRGRVYALEYKNSLTDTRWTALPLVAGTGATVTLSDPGPGPGQRFYRVRRW